MGRSSGGSSGGGGAVALVAANVLAAPAASVTFSGIAAAYNHLKLVVVAASAYAAEYDDLLFTFNGDTGAHYDTVASIIFGGNAILNYQPAAGPAFGNTYLQVPGASATAHTPGMVEIEVPCYALTTFNKIVKVRSGFLDLPTSGNDQCNTVFWGQWRSTAAVTSVTFTTSNAANFITGSAFYLYGIT